jgi:predicted lipoprotein with Yx(FWY)xxD motif
MLKQLFAVLFVTVLIASACGDSDDADSGGDETADLTLSSADLGDILVDAGGNTVYLFVPDSQGASTCYNDCEDAWPVVGELSAVGDGLDGELLGTTERNNGDTQATYNGWPLHYFSADSAPGDTKGQGVNNVWYVIDADGNAIGLG